MSKEIQFSLYISLIVLPFLIASVAIGGVGMRLGEMMPPSLGAQQQYQSDTMIVYRPDWRKRDVLEYKWQAIRLREPQVMMMGSSLGFMFRSEFFVQPDAFYNASAESMSPQETITLLNMMLDEEIRPQIVILNLDFHRFLSPAAPNAWEEDYSVFRYLYDHFRITVRRWLFDIELLTHNLDRYESDDVIYQGFIAINNRLGYRNDGSYFMARIDFRRERRMEINYRELEEQIRFFRTGDRLWPDTLSAYREILDIAVANDITVIGYLSPVHSDALTAFDNPEYAYIDDAKSEIGHLFAEYDMPYYDFMRAADIGGSDSELYDLRHAGEVLSLRMLQAMVADDPQLFAPYTDAEHIEALLDNPASDLLVFESPE